MSSLLPPLSRSLRSTLLPSNFFPSSLFFFFHHHHYLCPFVSGPLFHSSLFLFLSFSVSLSASIHPQGACRAVFMLAASAALRLNIRISLSYNAGLSCSPDLLPSLCNQLILLRSSPSALFVTRNKDKMRCTLCFSLFMLVKTKLETRAALTWDTWSKGDCIVGFSHSQKVENLCQGTWKSFQGYCSKDCQTVSLCHIYSMCRAK